MQKGFGFITPDAGAHAGWGAMRRQAAGRRRRPHRPRPPTHHPPRHPPPLAGGEDLFVHQTAILSEGFRSLKDGENVEFTVETAGDGRTRAVNVTGPNGQAPEGAPRPAYGACVVPA